MGEPEKYSAIAAHFRTEILEGRLVVGSKMPSVRDLCASWGVARSTAQRAVTLLKDEGLVVTARRNGTMVAGDTVDILIAIETPLLVLTTTLGFADAHVAGSLGIAEGSNVLVVRMMAAR